MGIKRGRAIQSDEADRIGFAAARQICRRHAKSFFFASYFLPKSKREAAYAVYSFCRMIDDAIDQPLDPGQDSEPAPATTLATLSCDTAELDRRLSRLSNRLAEIYEDRLRLPPVQERSEADHAIHAFALTVCRYEIPRQYFEEVAHGCRMDLTVKRYATWAALEDYCYHVAGVVGLIMCSVFGLRDERARAQAVAMGNAMQLTNILRDIREDWERGRVYLPQEDLARFGYTEQDIGRGVVDGRFRDLMRFEVARARALYEEGAAGLAALPADGSRLTASAMGVIYGGILGAIERQGYDVYTRRAHLTTFQKVKRLPVAWRLARREGNTPVPAGVF